MTIACRAGRNKGACGGEQGADLLLRKLINEMDELFSRLGHDRSLVVSERGLEPALCVAGTRCSLGKSLIFPASRASPWGTRGVGVCGPASKRVHDDRRFAVLGWATMRPA